MRTMPPGKKNLRAILRSGSELVSLCARILLLVACRPRVRVKRACAVGMARRGAQIGRLGAPCKAGGHCWPLTHGCRCRRAPQIRAMGDPIGRAAPPHERSQPRTAHEPRRSDAKLSHRFVLTKHANRARGRPTFQHTPSEPLSRSRAKTTQYGKHGRAGERGAAPSCGQLYQACVPGFNKPSLCKYRIF